MSDNIIDVALFGIAQKVLELGKACGLNSSQLNASVTSGRAEGVIVYLFQQGLSTEPKIKEKQMKVIANLGLEDQKTSLPCKIKGSISEVENILDTATKAQKSWITAR